MALPLESALISLSWGKIGVIVLSSSVFSALVTQVISWIRDLQKEKISSKREAKYLALRVAVVLESFSIECAKIITDNHRYEGAEECSGSTHSCLPSPPEYPFDVDWKSLPPDLSDRVLSFVNEITLSKQDIEFMYDIDEERIVSTCSEHAGKCGYRALLIASSLRKQHDLPLFDPNQFAWDILPILKSAHDAAFKTKRATDLARAE